MLAKLKYKTIFTVFKGLEMLAKEVVFIHIYSLYEGVIIFIDRFEGPDCNDNLKLY